ncbi:hypothetical protein K8B83_14890 [Shewanella inventionis]|uniref:hypothetical protein n=1 Tax=Shewanella inventionis TaxID=1738770 RepID=UPI001CBCECD0|nr:hypothetical protein [Shewanella inventionis]UAL42161.1 hypothetical protein K8B83_14890 [Shewanella inventionis]
MGKQPATLDWCDKKIAEMDQMIRDFPEHTHRLTRLKAGFIVTKKRLTQIHQLHIRQFQ